jgi:hypothetical protein
MFWTGWAPMVHERKRLVRARWLVERVQFAGRWGGCGGSRLFHETYWLEGDAPCERRCWLCGASGLREDKRGEWR